ncbi:MAG: ABC transporter permease [Acidimicrobiaceae bacterium]|nr:ABC transporter permease [Acidimicrobiaceae bacterium]
MLRTILLRLSQLIPVLFGVTLLSFLVNNALPGNIVYDLLGENPDPGAYHQLKLQLGLNHPPVQRYFIWLGGVLHGNLGNSLLGGQSVASEIRNAAAPTIELLIGAEVGALILCIGFAFWSVWTRSRTLDKVITSAALAGHCAPGFVVGLLFLLVFAVHWHLVQTTYQPISAGWGANLTSMSLPIATLALGIFPAQMRVFRGDMLQQLEREDYVALATIKGLSKARIIFKHVAKNSASNLVTIVALSIGFLFGGVVIVEQVFTIPGIGGLLFSSIQAHNAPVVQGIVLCVATVVVLANLVADLTYTVLDPRVRYDV